MCNFALRKTADDGKEKYSEEVCNTVLSNFYVDDYLKSIESESKAIQLVSDLTNLCKDGGFKLTKWLSNSREVLQSVPEDDRAETTKTLDLKNEELPSEKVLGLLWSPETDRFGFHIKVKERPPTRRGILATVSSIYDPLGFVAPAILPAKQILQNLSKLQLGWDESIPSELLTRWERWLDEVPKLSDFTIERCFKPKDFEESEVQMHHFCDASQKGYGSVSYLRFVNESGQVHLTLLTAKARVAPLKIITIPRLELTAAAMAVKVNNMLQKELQLKVESTYFWTDSQTVIKYINNDTARFHTFVANRVALIRDGSQSHQWKYVGTSSNPADDCSRGLAVDCFLKNRRWTDGPDFLHKAENQWPKTTIGDSSEELAEDPEVKRKLVVNTASTEEATDTMEKLLTRFSSWYQLCRCVAWILRVKKHLRKICRDRDDDRDDDRVDDGRKNDENEEHGNITDLLNVADMQEAERAVIVYVQTKAYPEEIMTLKELQLRSNDSQPEGDLRQVSKIKKASPLYRLNPFIEDGVIRVGGRLAKSALPEKTKFPSIIPKKSHIAKLILHDVHEATGHGGRNHMLAHLHKKYWITNANAAARKVINSCITCRKRNAKVQQQMMSDLPKDRVTPGEPPFSRVGMDYFGPLEVKQGRSIVKRYGVVFVCLASKAIHIEMAASLDTDACVNVIPRFVSRRGQVKQIRSDNGTNLIGAERELRREIAAWNQDRIHDYLLQREIEWTFNPPAGSHHGGIWERQIRTIRKVMCSVIKEQILTDDSLHTLLCEIEAIVNSRPLTNVPGEVSDLEPLTPNHLLQLKSDMILPPATAGKLSQYAKRRWRQVQYLADLFWRRWIKEYLPQLQQRQKWIHPQRNAKVGDVVMVVNESTPRNVWPLGRVIETLPASDGLVRRVRVKTRTSILTRPIDKLCLLLESEVPDQDIGVKKDSTSAHPPVPALGNPSTKPKTTSSATNNETVSVSGTPEAKPRRTLKPVKRLDL
ncbi:uncharacterized protein [Amphiura filiformis]|uniref:uncharacterized protein n=1 Tax=Amphiura filiformis TaxID=82378 RepID=UPI003B2206A5